jgi:sarcosine oxidase subunit beta
MNDTRAGVSHFDVVIAGGGLVGSSTALALAKSGMRVALIERRFCGAQASGVNYGGVRTQGRTADQLPLAVRARRVYGRLPELIGIDGEMVVSGHLRLARREADLDVLDRWSAMAREHGVESHVMSGPAFRQRYPWLGPAAIGGSLCPSDGHANPRLVSPGFAHAARRASRPSCPTSPSTARASRCARAASASVRTGSSTARARGRTASRGASAKARR